MGHENAEEKFETASIKARSELFFLPKTKRIDRIDKHGKKDRLESLEHEFEMLKNRLASDAKRAAKMEKKLGKYTLGFQTVSAKKRESVLALHDQLDTCSIEFETFKRLREAELQAIPTRTKVLV